MCFVLINKMLVIIDDDVEKHIIPIKNVYEMRKVRKCLLNIVSHDL